MTPENEAKVQKLVRTLEKAKAAYYSGSPEMQDALYDALENRLRELDPTNSLLTTTGAPVTPATGLYCAVGTKVRHSQLMTSLAKATTPEAARSWYSKVSSSYQEGRIFWSEKMDGLSVSVRYNGKITQAVTRGDGEVGQDITSNFMLMSGFPREVPGFSGLVRGEIYCPKSTHKLVFPNQANPRNTAAGIAQRQSNPQDAKHLRVKFYQVIPDNTNMPSKAEEFLWLTEHGFDVPNWNVKSAMDLILKDFDQYLNATRARLDYEIDGLVLEINDNNYREGLGLSGNTPVGAVALKFPSEGSKTILRDIVWQVGKSGRVTPVAVFDQVDLMGVKVDRASLATVRQVELLQLSAGCEIFVTRRNDVIPRVEANLTLGIQNT